MQTDYDFIIIGGGAAGLTAAQYGARSNLRTLVLESSIYGGQALNIMGLENYPGVFPKINGSEFITLMKNQAAEFGAKFEIAQVSSIDKINDAFVIKCNDKTFTCFAVLFATGAVHRTLNIPGEKEFAGRGVSYCATCDGPFFKNKPIAVIGGGDSACDEANYLSTLSSNVTLIHRKSTFRSQKAVAERVLRNPNIHVIFDTIVTQINGKNAVESLTLQNVKDNSVSTLNVNGVFIFVGIQPQNSLVEMLKTDENGYIITDENMQTAIKGMFCAGDLRAKPFRQLVTAASDGAIAAHSAEKYIREIHNEVYL